MSAYDQTIDRSGAEALIPEDVTRDIIQGVPQESAVMSLGRRLPNMSRNQRRMPVLQSLIQAYFVSPTDTGVKKTSKQLWGNKFIDAEELAVIVPIPESVLDDVDYDIWSEIKPRMIEAFGVAFDQAVFYGTNAPSSWPSDLLTGATAAGHTVVNGTGDDIYEEILGEPGTIAFIEQDGFGHTGHVASLTMRSKLRNARDADGKPIFSMTMQNAPTYFLDGTEVKFPLNGSVDPDQSLLISGDWRQLVWAIRQDVTYKLLDQAVITDDAGNIVYNLPQQDMVALRAVMRLGWQLPNPINRLAQVEADRYPFTFLLPAP